MDKTYTLANGIKMPAIGLGTWQSEPGVVSDALLAAFKNGYKHIDGAYIYQNEKEVGEAYQKAFKEGIIKREDLFVTSKLWNNRHRPGWVEKAFNQTLSDLQLDYLDLYLIHWPVATKPECTDPQLDFDDITLLDTWREMEKLYESGKVKAIGVCNCSITVLEELLKEAKIKPMVNQFECNPYLPQPKLIDYCKKNGIHVTAYCPIGSNSKISVLRDPIILDIAKKYQKTAAQVCLSWNVQRGVTVIPKSVHENRIIENSQTFTLEKEDMDKIATITTRNRVCDPRLEFKLNLFPDYNDY